MFPACCPAPFSSSRSDDGHTARVLTLHPSRADTWREERRQHEALRGPLRRHSKMLQVSELAVHGVLVSKEPLRTTCSGHTNLLRSLEICQKVVPRPILSLWTCRGGEERHGQRSLMRLIPNREAAHQIGLVDRITRLKMFPR